MSEETSEYLLRAEETLRAATLLITNGFYLDAISHAYYAMFYAASALMVEQEGRRFKKHSSLISAFGEYAYAHGIEAEYHHLLLESFDARNDADYIFGDKATYEDAEIAIANAQAFINRIREILNQQTS